jgi:GR25 family glycosyltransferase involved in LPS biosynthesis
VHYKPLKSRKHTMKERVLSELKLEPIWVEELDAGELTDTDIECVTSRKIQHIYINRNTTRGEDSLTLKHMAVYNFMVEQNMSNVLVLEDDATFLTHDWLKNSSTWKHILRELPENYDMVMLSGFNNMSRYGKKISDHLYLTQTSRVSSMYLVSQKGARNMLRTLPIVGPVDFIINWAGGLHADRAMRERIPSAPVKDIAIFWSEPHLSSQDNPLKTSSLESGRNNEPKISL